MKKLLCNAYEFVLLLLIGILFIIDSCIKGMFGEDKGFFKAPETNNLVDIYEINNL